MKRFAETLKRERRQTSRRGQGGRGTRMRELTVMMAQSFLVHGLLGSLYMCLLQEGYRGRLDRLRLLLHRPPDLGVHQFSNTSPPSAPLQCRKLKDGDPFARWCGAILVLVRRHSMITMLQCCSQAPGLPCTPAYYSPATAAQCTPGSRHESQHSKRVI